MPTARFSSQSRAFLGIALNNIGTLWRPPAASDEQTMSDNVEGALLARQPTGWADAWWLSYLGLLRKRQSVLYFDPEIADRALELRMAE